MLFYWRILYCYHILVNIPKEEMRLVNYQRQIPRLYIMSKYKCNRHLENRNSGNVFFRDKCYNLNVFSISRYIRIITRLLVLPTFRKAIVKFI